MEILTYKTNIQSEKALQKISGMLNLLVGSGNWQIDLSHRDHKLTVFSPGSIKQVKVEEAIKKAGFSAMNLEEYYSIF